MAFVVVVIFVPEQAAQTKVERLATYRCRVRRAGTDYDAAHLLAEDYAGAHDGVYLSAYDDPAVIAGQGTVGVEVMEELQVQFVPDGEALKRCEELGRRIAQKIKQS